MSVTNYPNGFSGGVSIRGLNILNSYSGKVRWVDSNHSAASDGNGSGENRAKPLATVNCAIGKSTRGDIISIAPGHNEGFTATSTGWDADVAGIAIIGIGVGASRPTFDFDDASAMCILGANDILLHNLVFRPSVTGISIGLDVETGVTGCVLSELEFSMGEDGAGVDEFIKAIHLTSGNHDTIFSNVKILAHASAASATHGIHVDAASNRLTFDNVIIDGPYATNGILEDAAGLNHVVVDCSVDVSGTNYGFHASSTFAKRTGNLDAGAVEDSAANFIGSNDADNAADTSSVAANADGSVLERIEYVQARFAVPTADVVTNAHVSDVVGNKTDASVQAVGTTKTVQAYAKGILDGLMGTGGITTFPAAAAAGNAVSIAEVIRYIQESQIGTLTNTGGTATLGGIIGDVANSDLTTRIGNLQSQLLRGTGTALPDNQSVYDLVAGANGIATWAAAAAPANGVSLAEAVRYISENQLPRFVSKTYADLTGYDVAGGFSVTGDVLVRIVGVVGATAITSTSGTTTLSVGTAELTTGILAAATVDNTQFAATDVWVDTSPANNVEVMGTTTWHVVGGGADINLVRSVDDITAGSLTLYCWWQPLSSDGAVVAV